MQSDLPDIHISTEHPILSLFSYTLWVCTVSNTLVSMSMPNAGPSWVDLVLNMIGKSAPIVSTFFLYIINRKSIDSYFKPWFSRKNKTKDKEK